MFITIKAISLHQPWAYLIAKGLKKYETRSWATNYRGELLICAAKAKGLEQKSRYLWLKDKYLPGALSYDFLRFGEAIALVELVDCVLMNEALIECQDVSEIDSGGWEVGRYAWKLENVRKVVPHIEIKGRQGLFDVNIYLPETRLEIVGQER